jgi:secretion/DNA translocation related TadE-like protein
VTRASDDGTVVVWVLALGMVLVALLTVGAGVADVLAARQRAAAAADLAALAAAPAAAYGDGEACTAAASVARSNGATLRSCRLADGQVWVSASARPRTALGRWAATRAGLNAGPEVAAHAGLG